MQNLWTKEEADAVAALPSVLRSFGIEDEDWTGRADNVNSAGEALDAISSVAVKRDHVPGSPGSCGDLFYIFDCIPENPLIIFKIKRYERVNDEWKFLKFEYIDITPTYEY